MEFPDVVLAHLLACCDVPTAVRLQSACKRLARIAADYLVWHDIARARAIDLAPYEAESAKCFVVMQGLPSVSVFMELVRERPFEALRDFDEQRLESLFESHMVATVSEARSVLPFYKTLATVHSIASAGSLAVLRTALAKSVALAMHGMGMRSSLSGFFLGEYGSHGTELVFVEHIGFHLRAFKVTGDPNVPAGELTWSVLLDAFLAEGFGVIRLAEHG